LIRCNSTTQGIKRLTESIIYHLSYSNEQIYEALKRIEVVVGDLQQPLLGLSKETFDSLSKVVDVIIHNGALVHWM
jgi:L-2-aminoadipate reductase